MVVPVDTPQFAAGSFIARLEMMQITVKLGGPLRKKVGGHEKGELPLEIKGETWVSDVLDRLGLDAEEVAVLMLNGRPLSQDKVLCQGDRLALFPKAMAFNTMTAVSFYNPMQRPKVKNKP